MENTTFTTNIPHSEETTMATKSTMAQTTAKKTRKKGSALIFHTDQELAQMGHAYPELLTATDKHRRLDLYKIAQHMLPRERRRPANSLYMACIYAPQYFEGTIKKMRAAMEQFASPPPPPKDKGTLTRWKDHEATLIAHDEEVKNLINDPAHDPASATLVDATLHAQARQLDRSRWRTRESLMQSTYNHRHLKHLREMLLHRLPVGLKPIHAHSVAEPEDTLSEALAVEQADIEADIEAVPASAPMPAPAAHPAAHPIADALAVIAQAIGPALTRLLSHVTTQVVRNVIAELKEPTKEPLSKAADAPTTEQISQAVRNTVIEILGAPPPLQVAPEMTRAGSEPIVVPKVKEPRGERIDIVGLIGVQETVVKKRCGAMFDLRFIAADDVGHAQLTAPIAILCTKFISHDAQERARASGSKVVYANGGVQSVVRRLRELTKEAATT